MILTKTKNKIILIVCICIVAALILGAVGFFIYQNGKLKRALDRLDITDKQTVINVLAVAKNNADVYIDVAKKQFDGGLSRDGVPLLWHVLQNIDSHNSTAKQMLKDYYGDSPMSLQVDGVTLIDTDAEFVTEHSGIRYGGKDGVYCSDYDGYARYKLSSARALSFSADIGGVYILDGADNCIKFISRDGKDVELVKKNVREFVYFESVIYSIDTEGKIDSLNEITLSDGELGANLRVVDSQVLCDIYDGAYSLIRTITLN